MEATGDLNGDGPRCNTCKAIFLNIERVKEHYRSDWHILNSKRRANNLVPLTKEEYKKALPILQKKQKPALPPVSSQIKNVNNSDAREGHNGDKPSVKKLSESSDKTSQSSEKLEGNVAINDKKVSDGLLEEDDDENWEDVDEGEEESHSDSKRNIPPEQTQPTASIFDNKMFGTIDECVEYMALNFGFFIPDIEYLCDRDGFLIYLNEKVKVGNICIYCQKKFRQYRACQHHMISKSHCKVAYAENIDEEEFEDFYDFSSSYEGVQEEYDEDGNVIEKALEISPIGELVLTDGRTLGNRAYRQFYKQRFHPEEMRDGVLALQREELLRLGSLQYGGQRMNMEELQKLTDVQVMSLLVERQKDIRYQQMIEQRSRQKRDFIDQRREYKSTVDKLRSSATTTAKIRDYHSRLV